MTAESNRHEEHKKEYPALSAGSPNTSLYPDFTLQVVYIFQNVFRKDRHPQHRLQDPVGFSNTKKLCSSSNNLPNSQLGYGTWQAAPGEVGNGVYEALKIGYRHLVSDPEDRWTLTAVALLYSWTLNNMSFENQQLYIRKDSY